MLFNFKKKRKTKKYYFIIFLFILLLFSIIFISIIFKANSSLGINIVCKISHENKKYFISHSLSALGTLSIKKAIINAVHDLLLSLIIVPLSLLIDGLMKIVYFLGAGNWINVLLFNNKTKFGLPSTFWICFWIAIAILSVFISLKFIHIMMSNYDNQIKGIRSLAYNIILLLFITPLVPMIFYVTNEVISIVISTILNVHTNPELSLNIFDNCFLNSKNSGIIHLDHIPKNINDANFKKYANDFSYLICIISYCFITWILLKMNIWIFLQIMELLFLFIISIIVLVSIISEINNSYSYINNYKNLVFNKWSLFSGIFLSFVIFTNSLVIINSININNSGLSKLEISYFKLITMFSISILTLYSSKIISQITGVVNNQYGFKMNLNKSKKQRMRKSSEKKDNLTNLSNTNSNINSINKQKFHSQKLFSYKSILGNKDE